MGWHDRPTCHVMSPHNRPFLKCMPDELTLCVCVWTFSPSFQLTKDWVRIPPFLGPDSYTGNLTLLGFGFGLAMGDGRTKYVRSHRSPGVKGNRGNDSQILDVPFKWGPRRISPTKIVLCIHLARGLEHRCAEERRIRLKKRHAMHSSSQRLKMRRWWWWRWWSQVWEIIWRESESSFRINIKVRRKNIEMPPRRDFSSLNPFHPPPFNSQLLKMCARRRGAIRGCGSSWLVRKDSMGSSLTIRRGYDHFLLICKTPL